MADAVGDLDLSEQLARINQAKKRNHKVFSSRIGGFLGVSFMEGFEKSVLEGYFFTQVMKKISMLSLP